MAARMTGKGRMWYMRRNGGTGFSFSKFYSFFQIANIFFQSTKAYSEDYLQKFALTDQGKKIFDYLLNEGNELWLCFSESLVAMKNRKRRYGCINRYLSG